MNLMQPAYTNKLLEFEKTDVHLHVPAGAIPKDGPSSGVAMVTAIASLFSGKSAENCHE